MAAASPAPQRTTGGSTAAETGLGILKGIQRASPLMRTTELAASGNSLVVAI